MTTVPHRLAAALAPHVGHVFGLMGNGNAHLLDALGAEGVGFTAVRHEAGTVAAADTHWRVGGGLAVASTTYGAGFTNTLTALAESVQAHIPLVLAIGGAPSTGARTFDVDQAGLCEAIGAPRILVTADDPEGAVHEAVRIALAERLPVVLELPYDLTRMEVPDLPPASAAAVAPAPVTVDEAALAEAARVLTGAKRPVILAGRGAYEAAAGPALDALARRLQAVTASTALARGIFTDEEHHLGVTGGFGQPEAMAMLRGADVVLVVGASLSSFTMRFGELLGDATTLIQLDVADAPTHDRVDQFVQGDARLGVEALMRKIPSSDARGEWLARAADDRLRERHPGNGLLADGKLDPRSVAARIGAALPENRFVVSDGGHFIGWANMYWPIASPERHVMVGTAYQTIGLGFPCAVGAAAARPGSTVVLSTGDGGGLMALADFESMVRACGSGIVVVWNDGAYGAEVHLYGVMGLDEAPMRIERVDFAGIGQALGATGVRVETMDDLDVLDEWIAAGACGTIVLDCRISDSVVADYQREIQRVNGL